MSHAHYDSYDDIEDDDDPDRWWAEFHAKPLREQIRTDPTSWLTGTSSGVYTSLAIVALIVVVVWLVF